MTAPSNKQILTDNTDQVKQFLDRNLRVLLNLTKVQQGEIAFNKQSPGTESGPSNAPENVSAVSSTLGQGK